jgi:hypothetical protein
MARLSKVKRKLIHASCLIAMTSTSSIIVLLVNCPDVFLYHNAIPLNKSLTYE